jgi:transposase
MKKPLPAINETPEVLQRLLHSEGDVQKYRRVQALYLIQTRQARTRRQVARVLGVGRNTVGRWLAAYEAGGVTRLLTIAKPPGKAPLLSPAMRQALHQRLAHPDGFASYKAIWQWLRQEYGLAIAYKTVHKFVRYTLRAKLKVPRKAHIKKR